MTAKAYAGYLQSSHMMFSQILLSLLAVLGGLLLCGCAGTRFTEMVWAVGCEEDYLVLPDNREEILFQSGSDYYLQCEERTYQNRPRWFHLLIPPICFRPNHYQYVSTNPQRFYVRIASEDAKLLNGNAIDWDMLVSRDDALTCVLPEDAQMVKPSATFASSNDRRVIDGVHEIIDGQKIDQRKSVGSYLLTPLMLPSLCIDLATHCCWPLNLFVGYICLENDSAKH